MDTQTNPTSAGAKPGRTVVKLGRLVEFKLMQLVLAEYEKSGLGDTEFARYAQTQLGDDRIKPTHIEGCRIPLNILAPSRVKVELTVEAMVSIEQRLSKLERTVDELNARLLRAAAVGQQVGG